MNIEYFFDNPKVMAGSGLLAMLLKWLISLILGLPMLFFTGSGFLISILFILYPVISIIIDLFLHYRKDKLWKHFPKPESIPKKWETTPEKLLEYAKILPTVRLLRFLGVFCLMPFMSIGPGLFLIELLLNVAYGFFIMSLLDSVWLELFKVKRPHFILKITKLSKLHQSTDSEGFRKGADVTLPGSPAWFAKKHIDSM